MTVTFYSNYLTLHQTAFCDAMVRRLGDGFRFVATEKIPDERTAMGYEDLSHVVTYAINSFESDTEFEEALKLGEQSDVVIIGSAPDIFIKERLKQNKLTFRYSERYFKQGRWRILDPRVLKYRYLHDFKYRRKNLYMLCASAYTAPDCRFVFSYPNKTFKWGYFPEVKKYDEDKLMERKRYGKPSILWVGRMIDWKQPVQAIRLAEELTRRGYDFELTLIGEGPERAHLENRVQALDLGNRVKFKNFMPQSEVRRHMEAANIFIFTSNQQEGWGAVLNEAMNSGCAVVANDQIGSVPFLIKEGENGLTYHKGANGLISCVETLVNNPTLTQSLGQAAYRTMQTVWNADSATDRLLQLIAILQSANPESPTIANCNAFKDNSIILPIYGPTSKC